MEWVDRPALVPDEEFQCGVGFGSRARRNAFFFFITNSGLSINYASSVLSAYCVSSHLIQSGQGNCTQDFHLFITNGVGIKCNWGLHGSKAEYLHDVVLYHISNSARLFVIFSACANAQALGDQNLYMIDIFLVP